MEKNIDHDEDFHKIKVFFSDDEKLKMLGELLSNKSSRDIIRLLSENEMYTNEIAAKLDLRPNLAIHHLKKLEELGLLEITEKKISKKGDERRHFKINPYFFLAPNKSKREIEENNVLKKVFKRGIKFALIGISVGITFMITDLHNIYNPNGVSFALDVPKYVIPLVVLIIGLIIVIALQKKEN